MTPKNVRVLLRSERWCKKIAKANGWVGNDFWVMLARFHGLNTRARVCSTNFEYPEHGQNRFFRRVSFYWLTSPDSPNQLIESRKCGPLTSGFIPKLHIYEEQRRAEYQRFFRWKNRRSSYSEKSPQNGTKKTSRNWARESQENEFFQKTFLKICLRRCCIVANTLGDMYRANTSLNVNI